MTRHEKSHEEIVDKAKLSVSMHNEQQRLMRVFCCLILAMNPSISQEISEKLKGEKMYQYNVLHEICNFGAKVIVESVFIFNAQYSRNFQDFLS